MKCSKKFASALFDSICQAGPAGKLIIYRAQVETRNKSKATLHDLLIDESHSETHKHFQNHSERRHQNANLSASTLIDRI